MPIPPWGVPPAPDSSTTVKGKVQLAGDLGGTAASPSVLKVNGVIVSGTPSSGQAIIASNGTTAAWGPNVSATQRTFGYFVG